MGKRLSPAYRRAYMETVRASLGVSKRRACRVLGQQRSTQAQRREGVKVLPKQPKCGRLWLSDGSCVRLRASWPNHVWSPAFVESRTHDRREFRMQCLIDEYSRGAGDQGQAAA
jgi:hypothetical protein